MVINMQNEIQQQYLDQSAKMQDIISSSTTFSFLLFIFGLVIILSLIMYKARP